MLAGPGDGKPYPILIVQNAPSCHAGTQLLLFTYTLSSVQALRRTRVAPFVLVQVHIPTVKVTSRRRVKGTDEQEAVTETRSRGFGFVQFLCPKDAARLVKVRGTYRDFRACVVYGPLVDSVDSVFVCWKKLQM